MDSARHGHTRRCRSCGYLAALANPGVAVIDAHDPGLERCAALPCPGVALSAIKPCQPPRRWRWCCQAPTLLQRRGMGSAVAAAPSTSAALRELATARLADLVHLSVAQFHARSRGTDGSPRRRTGYRGLRLDAAVLPASERGGTQRRPRCAAGFTHRPAPWPYALLARARPGHRASCANAAEPPSHFGVSRQMSKPWPRA